MKRTKQRKRPVITRAMLEAAYLDRLARERNSEWQYLMRTPQGQFWAARVNRVDFGDPNDFNADKNPFLSDNGAGAEAIRCFDERSAVNETQHRLRCIDRAKHRIARKCPEALPVFYLILKNGKNRKASYRWIERHWHDVNRYIAEVKKMRKMASCLKTPKDRRPTRPAKGVKS